MPTPLPARHIAAPIACSYDAAYAFLQDPSVWSQWAAGLGAGLERAQGGEWIVRTVAGEPARVRFASPNPYGVLDHTVILPGGARVEVPLRLIRSGDGCEIVLTLLRLPTMSDADYAADAAAVERDLAALKALLET
jgi:hypothetical protein